MLIGHPEHDLLFIATQVARAAGLKHPSMAIQGFHNNTTGTKLRLGDPSLSDLVRAGKTLPSNTWLFDESRVYGMLLRGHAPQSEPFRKWVTEEVLPSIRKTGSYNVNESTTETGQQFAGE